MSERQKQRQRREEVRKIGRGGVRGGGAAGSSRWCSARSFGSQADCCHGKQSNLIYKSAAHLKGQWLCFAKSKECPGIRSSDWNKNGTEGSFLTLKQDREINTFCLLAKEIAVNKGFIAKQLVSSHQPTPLHGRPGWGNVFWPPLSFHLFKLVTLSLWAMALLSLALIPLERLLSRCWGI